jgi:hypothetical protein
MKICPECQSTYTNETLTKCPNDGTELVEESSLNQNSETGVETAALNQTDKTKKTTDKTSSAVDVKSVKSSAPQKSKGNSYLILVVAAVLVLLGVLWWYSQKPKNNGTITAQSKVQNTNGKTTTAPNPTRERKPPTMTDYQVGNAQSPTEAYKMLFAAVKSQETAKIKSMYSKGSIGLAEMQSARSNQPIERVYENGFTETTFVDDFPQMRDERIKDKYGAVEVWNESRKQWDDIPFIFEDGSWKLAIGDAFANTWKTPGKGQAQIEQENANANNPNLMIRKMPSGNANTNGNFRSGGKVTKPKNQ